MNDAPKGGGQADVEGVGGGWGWIKAERQSQTGSLQLCTSLFYRLYILLTFFLCLCLLAGHLCSAEHHLNVSNMKYGALTLTGALKKP